MSGLLRSRKANTTDLKKGFVFFMEQEKTELKRVRNKMKQLKQKMREIGDGKEKWDDSPEFHPISEWTLQRNEYYDIRQEVQ